jgi:hypothetical protein
LFLVADIHADTNLSQQYTSIEVEASSLPISTNILPILLPMRAWTVRVDPRRGHDVRGRPCQGCAGDHHHVQCPAVRNMAPSSVQDRYEAKRQLAAIHIIS